MEALSTWSPARKKLAAVLAALGVLCGVVFVVSGGDDDVTKTASPSPTTLEKWAPPETSAPPVTLAPLGELDHGYEVAIVKPEVETVRVYKTPPAGAINDVRVSARWAEWSQANLPPRTPAGPVSPLPSPGQNVAGRVDYGDNWVFTNPNGLGSPTAFVVTENHGPWLKVMVPTRPNGQEGWIAAADVYLEARTARVEIYLAERLLRVIDGDQVLLETPIVVGADATPTPTGRLYTAAHLPGDGAGYGAHIISLSGYSEALEVFQDGAPAIAMHGTNQPQLAGQAVSNGCIRVPSPAIDQLVGLTPMGTVVDIWPSLNR